MRNDGCRELRVEVTPAQWPRLGPLLDMRGPDRPEALLLKLAQPHGLSPESRASDLKMVSGLGLIPLGRE